MIVSSEFCGVNINLKHIHIFIQFGCFKIAQTLLIDWIWRVSLMAALPAISTYNIALLSDVATDWYMSDWTLINKQIYVPQRSDSRDFISIDLITAETWRRARPYWIQLLQSTIEKGRNTFSHQISLILIDQLLDNKTLLYITLQRT